MTRVNRRRLLLVRRGLAGAFFYVIILASMGLADRLTHEPPHQPLNQNG
jgi:hypothetical protein